MAHRSTSKRRVQRRSSAHVKSVLVTRTVLCTITGISEGQLAVWEQEDLLAPARIAALGGRQEALYNHDAIERIRVIRSLGEDLEVNLPGIGVILHLLDRISR
ncbi:MAG TPA: chaperone modulator CbpM [Candidatus Binataceae bacterium]|nr:chaperone modulator CbpM [Candidatus Binataceae bacterium]